MCAQKKAADRHITLRKVRKRLKGRSNKELISLISKCYRSGSEAKRILTFELSSHKKNKDVMATVVIAPSPLKDREIVEKDKEFVFITNGPVDEETISDHIDQYDHRWGIETGFRVRNGFQIKTNTNNVVLRYFFFLMAAMLYNFWLLANVLKGWKPNPHYDYDILAREFRWALECLIAFDIRPDG